MIQSQLHSGRDWRNLRSCTKICNKCTDPTNDIIVLILFLSSLISVFLSITIFLTDESVLVSHSDLVWLARPFQEEGLAISDHLEAADSEYWIVRMRIPLIFV